MSTLNIHLKIEAKKTFTPGNVTVTKLREVLGISLNDMYETFSCPLHSYTLPYKVQKLSKRAKRNQM